MLSLGLSDMVSLEQVTALLVRHEGYRDRAYKDSRGYLTIGYGTNLDAVGAAQQCKAAGVSYAAAIEGDPITREQGQTLLQRAARYAMDCAQVKINGFKNMPTNVQLAVIDQIYNMGLEKFGEFHKEIEALEARNWPGAVAAMTNSAWYHQVGQRARDDIALVESAIGVTA